MHAASTRTNAIFGVAVALLLLALPSSGYAQTKLTRPPEADKVHVVLVVNGTDKAIGETCLHDIQAMRSTLAKAFAKDKSRVVLHDLTLKNPRTGKLFADKEVVAYLKNLKAGSNDNVLFYHSGHGAIGDAKKPEQTHTLFIDGGVLSRWEVEQTLVGKKPRATMVLTDCCSVFPRSLPSTIAASRTPPPTKVETVNVQTVRNLLLKTVGVVSITAARDGEEASSGHTGADPAKADGAFTVALLRLWYRQDVTYTSWSQFFPALRSETGKASNGKQFARAFQLPK